MTLQPFQGQEGPPRHSLRPGPCYGAGPPDAVLSLGASVGRWGSDVDEAAEALGVSRRQIYVLLDRYRQGIFAALAEFERELISERTLAGLASARARGRNGGRPYKMTPAKLRLVMASWAKPAQK